MNGLNDSAQNTGAARTHALELNFQRRFAQGFMLNASYTRMLQENRTFLDNEFETAPTIWYPSDTARPHRFTATGIYELPFGKGRAYLQDGILNHILGGWQIAATYEFQPGPLLAWGNIFYHGDLNTFAEDVTANDQDPGSVVQHVAAVRARRRQPAGRVPGPRLPALLQWRPRRRTEPVERSTSCAGFASPSVSASSSAATSSTCRIVRR